MVRLKSPGNISNVVLATVLMTSCQCLVPVTEADSGLSFDGGSDAAFPDGGTLDASVVDSGAVDSGAVDSGTVDSGNVDSGVADSGVADSGVDGGFDAGRSCATVHCSAWATCLEDAGATCVDTVIGLRWVAPARDAGLPIDTIRLGVSIEVTGAFDTQIPVRASGAGDSTTDATRRDAGLAIGTLSFATLDAGQLLLTAGWDGGPSATTIVRVLPTRAIEIVGNSPPSYGVNSADFEPNDPDGNAWRRDDVVPLRIWPGAELIARHASPNARAEFIDAGEACDGGCSALRLQDVEFNAFRGEVEVRVVSDAGWEARGERLTVTRWRWRRVVAGIPNPIKVQTPVMTLCSYSPFALCIVVGTEDTRSTGRLTALSEDGLVMASVWLPQNWTYAVTAPIVGCHQVIAGFDGDAGFIYSGRTGLFGADSIGERYVLLGGTDAISVAVTDVAGVVGIEGLNAFTDDHAPLLSGRCSFDAGVPVFLGTARFSAAISSSSGEVCIAPEFVWRDAGTTLMSPERVFPFALAGAPPHGVTTDGVFVRLDSPSRIFDAGVVDTLVQSGFDWYFFTNGPALVRFSQFSPGGMQATRTTSIPLRVTSPPIFTAYRSTGWPLEGMIYALAGNQRLMAFSTASLSESWGWSPDGGIELSAPMGFAPSVLRNGSILLPTGGSVVSVVADSPVSNSATGWSQAGGDAWNCGGEKSGGGFWP